MMAGPEFTGSVACRHCHPKQSQSQAVTGHAQALRPVASHPMANRFFPSAPLFRSGYRFDFRQGRVLASSKTQSVETPLEWAFGAGDQAVTFVSRVNRDYYVEHFFTYLSALGRLGPTPGQEALNPAVLAEAVGLLYKTRDPATGIDACFECHSTGGLRFSADNAIEPREPGVRCEACHGPASEHLQKPGRGSIQNPKLWSAGRQLEFCGKCHRPPAARDTKVDWNFAWNVRHQPVYLSESACYRASAGRLTCLTCHDPHSPLEKAATSYNAQCSRCHQQTASACATNCVDCHMPRVSPQAPLRFTNHWIGVYGPGAKLRPRN